MSFPEPRVATAPSPKYSQQSPYRDVAGQLCDIIGEFDGGHFKVNHRDSNSEFVNHS